MRASISREFSHSSVMISTRFPAGLFNQKEAGLVAVDVFANAVDKEGVFFVTDANRLAAPFGNFRGAAEFY